MEDEREDKSGSHCADESHYAEEDGAKAVGGEEFVVEEENGDFNYAQTERVNELDYPANLER